MRGVKSPRAGLPKGGEISIRDCWPKPADGRRSADLDRLYYLDGTYREMGTGRNVLSEDAVNRASGGGCERRKRRRKGSWKPLSHMERRYRRRPRCELQPHSFCSCDRSRCLKGPFFWWLPRLLVVRQNQPRDLGPFMPTRHCRGLF